MYSRETDYLLLLFSIRLRILSAEMCAGKSARVMVVVRVETAARRRNMPSCPSRGARCWVRRAVRGPPAAEPVIISP